ncbi:MAG: ABC transporter [Novosphingobium sp. 17-62-19]|uniref:ABC-F family ATP-binding cassette domain-containing protein n=1 Tax=Novosphingobium sp. 17-62-19 TaxID=1970406 RepID=UPI000BCA0B63|nr:ABC-F family ATP-binding cassette domain-containing protein [Novosphingobium sp. 17-62-19]OYX92393.1 MAG: ABC transporter [Novosphingobium sp. 35-62-5]OZA21483.1 MAG: ABC transporter [Novosphingobium sp. 17-62-19]HQS96006.1 ABC-F family ATP-binding cassette domain-containing protein [Novosphingobium sp.]
MPASITLASISWSAPDGRSVLNDLNASFGTERLGIVGRNGTGKSTLLRLIAGDLSPSTGRITRLGTISVLRQIVARSAGETLAEALGVANDLAVLRRAEAGFADAKDIESADWTLEQRLAEAFAHVRLSASLDTPVVGMSGGELTKAGLAFAILANPDFLLLDEPTNNLDSRSRDSLGAFLASWRKGALVVSHDRVLLEGMDAILELTSFGATRYGGPYSHYRDRKDMELATAQQARDSAERALNEVRDSAQVARERKGRRDGVGQNNARKGGIPRILLGARRERAENSSGTNARLAERETAEAQSRLMEARASLEIIEPLRIELGSTGLSGSRKVIQLTNVTFSHPGQSPLFSGLDFTVVGPERVAIIGPNGAGKSTLMHLIAGRHAPDVGTVSVSVPFAMLDQHTAIFDPELSIVANLRRLQPDLDENAARAALARFRFRASAADQIVASLSGGQAIRAALACVLSTSPPPLILLDEPTNHLDLEAVQAIEAGLAAYDGALVAVSHDAAFLEAIGITRRISLV